MASKSFTQRPFYAMAGGQEVSGSAALPHIQRLCPNALFGFTKNANGNVVVMEVVEKPDGKLGMEQYWLDIDPEYVKSARKNGKTHDRVEMKFYEAWGYGFSEETTAKGSLKVKMSQSIAFVVKRVDGRWRAIVMMDKAPVIVTEVHIQTSGNLLDPRVSSVEARGYRVAERKMKNPPVRRMELKT